MATLNVSQILPSSILIVDDSKQTVIMHAKYSRTACPDIAIQTAYDGNAAWESFQSNPTAVAMLDIEMPGISGVELAEKIYRYSPSTGIIVFSVNLTQNIMLKFASIDVDFAKKPASEFDVAVKVRSALRSFEKDVELERMKICARLTIDLNTKQFPLPVIKFLRDLAGDPKSIAKINFLKQAAELESIVPKFLTELGNGSGKRQLELLRTISKLDDEALTFIKELADHPNHKDQIELCRRVLNPPSSQIKRAIVDCLYPENR